MIHECLKRAEEEMILRNYSPKTIKSYSSAIRDYLGHDPAGERFCNVESLRRFLLIKQDKGYAPQTVNLYLMAVKFYYLQVLKLHFKIDLKFAKKSKKLPVVLSREEVAKVIESITNHKHKTMISLAYGAGLRVSEVVRLKVQDLQFDEGTIHLKQAKGKKDRLTLLPERLIEDWSGVICSFLQKISIIIKKSIASAMENLSLVTHLSFAQSKHSFAQTIIAWQCLLCCVFQHSHLHHL